MPGMSTYLKYLPEGTDAGEICLDTFFLVMTAQDSAGHTKSIFLLKSVGS